MSTARRLLHGFKASDGRTKVATVLGVSTLVAVLALLVGILPAIASDPAIHSTSGLHPVIVSFGGGSGACSAELEGRLPSAAGSEFHINNPTDGVTYTSADGYIEVIVGDDPSTGVTEDDNTFKFNVTPAGLLAGQVVYDVVVNGGPKNNHYDYDDHPDFDNNPAPGTTTSDGNLHAPNQGPTKYHNLSHINLCYDVEGVTIFVCEDPVTLTDSRPTGTFFAEVTGTIFANSPFDCATKRASYVLDNDASPPTVTLTFSGDGSDIATGRLDFTKIFLDGTGDPNPAVDGDPAPNDFTPLEYQPVVAGTWYDLSWCALRDFEETAGPSGFPDGTEFSEWLGQSADSTGDYYDPDAQYPTLTGVEDAAGVAATACKVAEVEDASGKQFTVAYFEFVDPKFR